MAILSADKKSVTVEKGDTLSQIALDYKAYISGSDNAARIKTLVDLNDIENPDKIVVGQKLKLSGTATKKKTTTSKVTIKSFGLQTNTDRTVYVSWSWTKSNTENYQVIWYYHTGDTIWFIGSDSTVTDKQSTYNAPANATKVKVKIRPISKKKESNGNKETYYWTANWSTEQVYNFSKNPPTAPRSAPSVGIENNTLTASLDNISGLNATHIEFVVYKNNEAKKYATSPLVKIVTGHAAYSTAVSPGNEYKVRCRSYNEKLKDYSGWSEYSSNYGTMPATPTAFTVCRANSETSIYLEWKATTGATSYTIEYTTEKKYFDSSASTTTEDNITATHFEIFFSDDEIGKEYFFRLKAKNDQGESGWSAISSCVTGRKPAAPTTWSSSSSVTTGDPLTLYWVHNSEDGSSQTYAEVEITVGENVQTYTVKNTTDEEEKDKTSSYILDTSSYTEGASILWRVRTAGITNQYGDWSTQRTVDIYASPTLELSLTDANAEDVDTLTTYPLNVNAVAGPNTQLPIGFHLSIVANESYETVDDLGNDKFVKAGDTIYSKYVNATGTRVFYQSLTAGDLDLENNMSYTVTCVAAMDSGLTGEATATFTVAWSDDIDIYEPNAEIAIDADTLAASIRPYCVDEDEVIIEGVTLTVYRREYDGRFTRLEPGNLDNSAGITITDPHPSLDYARYRVVATSTATGTVTYCDLPGIPIDEAAVVIQWDEDWTYFDVSSADEMEEPVWSGSMLKLPFNVDISDSFSPDVSLIEYVGREHPVSYYGTQKGESSTWNVEIDKKDEETLYALRRLAKWMGDVYVREPSGSGYWAHITVSFSQTHCELTIPVSLNVTRVEGGI